MLEKLRVVQPVARDGRAKHSEFYLAADKK